MELNTKLLMMTSRQKTLLVCSFIFNFALGLLGPFYAVYVNRIGGDLLEMGIAFGLFSVCSGVFTLLISRTNSFKLHLDIW